MRKKLLSMLVLLCLTVSSAWAQEETLLTTIVNTGDNASFTSGSKTFDNIATVSFSGNVGNEGDDYWGWYSMEGEATLTVTAAEGYTITRVKFYNASGSAFDEEAPFEAILVLDLYNYKIFTKVNGTSIGEAGVTQIDVYGYATPAPTSYNVTANLAGGAYWATFYTEAGNYQAPEGTQVFAVNLNTSTAKITMIEISDRIVKSGEGVVLKNTTTGSITMSKTETAPAGDFSSNSLTGTMTNITNPGNAYVLNNKNGIGFYKLKETGTLGANKAYLTYSGGGGAPLRDYFEFLQDETTGIQQTEAEVAADYGTVYDLQGRPVTNPAPGIYIVNGKKVFIK